MTPLRFPLPEARLRRRPGVYLALTLLTGVLQVLAALACITLGTIAQKRIALAPTRVLPLQCAVALLLCLALLPVQPLRLNATPMLAVSVLWLVARLIVDFFVSSAQVAWAAIRPGYRPLGAVMEGLTSWLESMSGSSAVLLGLIIGLMMCFDLGGPVNKAAYLFGTAAGPHPFPLMVRDLQRIVGMEAREQVLEAYGRYLETIPEAKRAELMTEYEDTLCNPYVAAERGYIDTVITPSNTRMNVSKALRALRTKRESLPPKKHGNIPL